MQAQLFFCATGAATTFSSRRPSMEITIGNEAGRATPLPHLCAHP
jgi:hypothetical protein